MTPFVYAQSRPDFFRPLQKDEYEQQVTRLITLPPQGRIGFSEREGFIHLSLVDKIIESVKGLLGFEDKGHSKRVEAEWLKFLYYGEAQGFLSDYQLTSLRDRFSFCNQPLSPIIKNAFEEIARHRRNQTSTQCLSRLRAILIDFHAHQSNYLQPCLWKSLFQKPDLDVRQLIHFGDTSLVLAQQALMLPQPNVRLALKYFLEAQKLKNIHPEFQRKFALQFKQFIDTYQNDPAISEHQTVIQRSWIELAKVAYANHRQTEAHEYTTYVLESHPNEEIKCLLGELFLSVSDFDRLEPFLPTLQQAHTQNATLQIQIGKAYWHYQRFPEGVSAYQRAIYLLEQQDPHTFNSTNSSLQAELHLEIGKAYIQKLEGLNDQTSSSKAIAHLSKANQLTSNQETIQRLLLDAYHQQWQTDPEIFTERYKEEWLQTLHVSSPELIHEKRENLISMLLICSEQAFARHHNSLANEYLETGVELFEDPSFVLQILELTLKYKDFKTVNDVIERWDEVHYSHPFIQERIGDVYSNVDRNQALSAYHEAIHLFEETLQRGDIQEEAQCRTHLANLQAKVSHIQLETEPGFFTQIPYDNAITRLETAVSLNASAHTQTLFEAYLAAAKAEQEKNFLSYDRAKAINYYAKAFRLTQQNGPYLNDLMTLYLSHRNDYAQATLLFSEILKQPWANEFQLNDVQLHQLAKQFIASNQNEMALVCLKKAHAQQPSLVVCKRDLYQLILTQAKDLQAKAALSQISEEKIQLLGSSIDSLTKQFDEGFTQIDSLESHYRTALSGAYRQMAQAYMQVFALDESERMLSRKNLLRPHLKHFQQEIQSAIDCYTSALQYCPEDPSLYFERGMIHDLKLDLEVALQDYRRAVQYQRHNSFYRKRLAFTYGVLAKIDKMHEHESKLKDSREFYEIYTRWSDEYFIKNKVYHINPHTL